MSRKPRIEPYHEAGGGWGATKATAAVLLEQKVLFKGAMALYYMNKPGGFKCPSCAWPDPAPGHGDSLVFCENGAKALAFEATAKRVTPEFFAKHSVTDLAKRSDYWLEEQGRITHPMVYDPASDHYVPIDWQNAFALIGEELRGLSIPTRRTFTLRAGQATKRHSSTSYLRGNSGRTIFRIAQTFAMSRPARDYPRRLASARVRACLKTLITPI
jgi:anaerobic selenocysteine-containing dehydrogenase